MEQLNLEQLIHIVSTVISAQNALIDSYSLYENNENKIFQLKLDQALIFRLILDYSAASSAIAVLKNNASNYEVQANILNYYDCLITNELFIINSSDKQAYQNIDECRSYLNLNEGGLEDIGSRPEDQEWDEGSSEKTGNLTNISSKKKSTLPVIAKKGNEKSINNTLIQVYPNPAFDNTDIKLPIGLFIKMVEISDIAGRTVNTYSKTNLEGGINIPIDLNEGIYFIKIFNDAGSIHQQKLLVTSKK